MPKGNRIDPIRDADILKRIKGKDGQNALDLYNKERFKSKGNQSILNKILTEGNVGAENPNEKPKGKDRYNAKKVILADGTVFDSTWEYAVWNRLLILQRIGKIHNLNRQIEYPCIHNDVELCTVTLDFVFEVPLHFGNEVMHREARRVIKGEFVEVIADAKSKRTARTRGWTLVSKIMWACYSKPVTFFQEDNDVESVVYSLL